MVSGGNADRGASGTGSVPAGYAAVPIEPSAAGGWAAPVRVCVLARRQPDRDAGRFVVVRQASVARALLGCLTDAAGTVLEWVEVWVQSPPTVAAGGPPGRGPITNGASDRRWEELVAAFAKLGPTGGFVATGWEAGAGRPLALSPDLARIAPPAGDWSVCVDEAALSAAGLPGYAASPHRYLVRPDGRLSPATTGGPAGGAGAAELVPLASVLGGSEPFNVEGGRMFVRRHGPVPVEALWDVLAGRPWRGVGHGATVLPMGGAVDALRSAGASAVPPDEGRLFLGRWGRWGRVLESYHLRVRMLADMVAAVRQAVVATGRPLLSLTPQSFQAQLPDASAGLPFMWAARVMLADAGDAVELRVPGSDLTYFQPPPGGTSVYQPTGAQDIAGDGVLRVRQVIADAAQGTVVEGTLVTNERAGRTDGQLLWMRPTLASGPVDLYGRLTDGVAAGEWRFRTVGQRLPGTAADELQAAAGVPLSRVPFALIGTATTAADSYALAVMAAQALLVDPATFPLPVVVDELTSLGRLLAEQHDPGVGLALRLRSAVEADRRWLATLGPQRLVAEPLSPDAALDLIPIDLWCETLAAIVRMFPGLGPDSACPTWDDPAAAAVPTRPFDPALTDFDGLIRRSRSLIVIDWRFNREVRSAIRARLAAMGTPDATATTRW
jgi:hypothetical protein